MNTAVAAGSTYLTYILTPFTVVTAYTWYFSNLEATGRLKSLDAAVKAISDLYEDLMKEAQEIALTPQERHTLEKQAATLKTLKAQLRVSQQKVRKAGIVQKNWQWGQFISRLKDLEEEIDVLNEDVLTTTNTLNARNAESQAPSPQAVYQSPGIHSHPAFNSQHQYSRNGAPVSVIPSPLPSVNREIIQPSRGQTC